MPYAESVVALVVRRLLDAAVAYSGSLPLLFVPMSRALKHSSRSSHSLRAFRSDGFVVWCFLSLVACRVLVLFKFRLCLGL